MEFSELQDNLAVDLNPESMMKNYEQLLTLGLEPDIFRETLLGKFLIVSKDLGSLVMEPTLFHEMWEFYTPDNASRVELRTIIRRKK